ncbi:MAG: YabP/YqfC family sporulation protein [Lachnospiraceae bacterium]|nr:YabP/YqfC family sporulation protein [Lachnospiraceae bacterium]
MNIPGDVLCGELLIRMFGNREIIIENHKGIHLYTSEEIIITCKHTMLRICGEKLLIQYFSGCDMKITGIIQSISYISKAELCC